MEIKLSAESQQDTSNQETELWESVQCSEHFLRDMVGQGLNALISQGEAFCGFGNMSGSAWEKTWEA